MPLATIEEAVEEFRRGNFVIIIDDKDRENEGDLCIPAEKNHAREDQLHGEVWARPHLHAPHRPAPR